MSKFLPFILVMVNSMSFTQTNVSFDQYRLDNGLTVIVHEDHSAPVAAVVAMYHVGSKNEKVKRTGFAHLFEHVMFKGSEHVADGEHFKLLQEIGANINGFTTEDGTTYFEVVPSNYVELALYLESDRMGFLLPAVTQEKLDNQRDVVKNERRQRVDNVPYGTADERFFENILRSQQCLTRCGRRFQSFGSEILDREILRLNPTRKGFRASCASTALAQRIEANSP
ncbi:MAG: insulinase family protein [Ignavibacteriae bacterium]|nr:insulinase family protein [Ignavibacteriota bacterium]